ncbi:MAG: GNAT family N-acetyltransferase, partial [Bacteroidota bacterium]
MGRFATLVLFISSGHTTFESKAYWGYAKEQLDEWHDDLLISEKYIENNEVFLTKKNDRIICCYYFKIIYYSTVKLDNIFIQPKYIGKGLGTILMEDFLYRMKESQITVVTLDSEPNANQFYQKFG